MNKNKYIYNVVNCLKRVVIIDSKGNEYLLNKINLFDSKKGEIIFSSCNNEFKEVKYFNKCNISYKGEINFNYDINKRNKLNLNKKEFFIIASDTVDDWEKKRKYDLYIDINLLENNYKLETEETETATQYKIQKHLYLYDNFVISSFIESKSKGLEAHKAHEIEKLNKLISMFNSCENMEQLEELKNKYTRGIYL